MYLHEQARIIDQVHNDSGNNCGLLISITGLRRGK